MKSILLSALFCSFFFLSCSSDDSTEDVNTTAETLKPKKSYARTSNAVSGNLANAYDLAGNLQYQLLVSAIESTPSNTLSSIVTATNNVALTNTNFINAAPLFTGLITSQVQWVIDCNGNTQTVVNASGLSANGKSRLGSFLLLMDGAEANDYSDNYDVIVDFEAKVTLATNLTVTDKALILRTTSIARYTCFYIDDRDKDWGGLKNSLIGAVKGATTNMDTAITLAVAAGIQQDFN